ncbi:response regulator, partial [Streptomyces sp. NPDC058613]
RARPTAPAPPHRARPAPPAPPGHRPTAPVRAHRLAPALAPAPAGIRTRLPGPAGAEFRPAD